MTAVTIESKVFGCESESEFAIRVELAGIKRDQVRVMLDGCILSIAGKREREQNDSDQTDRSPERGYESLTRVLRASSG
jgi:HSP20 family molecular chaperone IbpA